MALFHNTFNEGVVTQTDVARSTDPSSHDQYVTPLDVDKPTEYLAMEIHNGIEMVNIQGMWTTRSGAEAAGLIRPNEGPTAAQPVAPVAQPVVAPVQAPAQDSEGNEIVTLDLPDADEKTIEQYQEAIDHEKAGADYNEMLDNLDQSQLNALQESIVSGDVDPNDVLPAGVADRFANSAVEAAGYEAVEEVMSEFLEDGERRQALTALIEGRHQEFSSLAQTAKANVMSYVQTPEFQASIEASEGNPKLIGGMICFEDGERMDPVLGLLNGDIQF